MRRRAEERRRRRSDVAFYEKYYPAGGRSGRIRAPRAPAPFALSPFSFASRGLSLLSLHQKWCMLLATASLKNSAAFAFPSSVMNEFTAVCVPL